MKSIYLITVSVFTVFGCTSTKQLRHNDEPVILANSEYIDYRIGDVWYNGQWSIVPEIAHDTLEVICYGNKESFEFKTDIDKIQYEVSPNTTKGFYVKTKEGQYAHTVIKAVPFRANQIEFSNDRNEKLKIAFQNSQSDYLDRLKASYPLEFINDQMTDTETVLSILNWTNSRWSHNGNNSPSKNDAITILEEAAAGKEFPCFAYAIVLRDQLTSLGYKARTIYLKTQDAHYRQGSPGHVATEVYLDDINKWVFTDGQFNIMPTLNGIPLNAVELQDAISNHFNDVVFESLSKKKTSKKAYVDFVYDYLYYFDTSLDNRYNSSEKNMVNGKRSIMLVPKGADNLTHINFWDMDVDYCVYTNSQKDFYARPQ